MGLGPNFGGPPMYGLGGPGAPPGMGPGDGMGWPGPNPWQHAPHHGGRRDQSPTPLQVGMQQHRSGEGRNLERQAHDEDCARINSAGAASDAGNIPAESIPAMSDGTMSAASPLPVSVQVAVPVQVETSPASQTEGMVEAEMATTPSSTGKKGPLARLAAPALTPPHPQKAPVQTDATTIVAEDSSPGALQQALQLDEELQVQGPEWNGSILVLPDVETALSTPVASGKPFGGLFWEDKLGQTVVVDAKHDLADGRGGSRAPQMDDRADKASKDRAENEALRARVAELEAQQQAHQDQVVARIEAEIAELKAEQAKALEAAAAAAEDARGANDATLTGSDVQAALAAAKAAVADLQRTAGELPVGKNLPIVAMPVLPPSVAPFSQEAVGNNIKLSQDGFTATRSSGCRDSVALGKVPLRRQTPGLYFELEVCQTVEGWLGGLGIGVTHTDPSQLKEHRLPDKAWRFPGTFVVGYSGARYLNGANSPADWQPDALKVGQRVGLLMSGDGRTDMVIFVDGAEVMRLPGEELRHAGLRDEPLFAIVDVYNATVSVKLLPGAVAPEVRPTEG